MNTPSHRDNFLTEVTLLNVRQVADLLGVHSRSIWRMVQTRSIPAPIRLTERVVRWRLSDLREHLGDKHARANGGDR